MDIQEEKLKQTIELIIRFIRLFPDMSGSLMSVAFLNIIAQTYRENNITFIDFQQNMSESIIKFKKFWEDEDIFDESAVTPPDDPLPWTRIWVSKEEARKLWPSQKDYNEQIRLELLSRESDKIYPSGR
jgi:hypothetical protein